MAKIKVGVLRGGPSREHNISMITGACALENIDNKIYEPIDIFISQQGKWYFKNSRECDPIKILSYLDVVFNALHGRYGEDGQIQRFLEGINKPYTGSRPMPSSVAMNKILSREAFVMAGLMVAPGFAAKKEDDQNEIVYRAVREIGPPLVVKPACEGSSLGVKIVYSPNELLLAIQEAFDYGGKIIIEKFIKGREATVGVLEEFRKTQYYPLPPVEIIPPKQKLFFDYESKYDDSSREICPGRFGCEISKQLLETAIKAHCALGLRHYSRVDMIVAKEAVYVLEVNSQPGLTSQSLFPKAGEAVGLKFPQLINHLLELALKRDRGL